MKATKPTARNSTHFPALRAWACPALMCLFILNSFLAQTASRPEQARKEGEVSVQMSNVMYHFQDDIAVHVRRLGAVLIPTKTGQMPVFDDKGSFVLEIAAAELAIKPQSLANTLNRNVLVAKDAPIKDLSIAIETNRLKIKGKLAHEVRHQL